MTLPPISNMNTSNNDMVNLVNQLNNLVKQLNTYTATVDTDVTALEARDDMTLALYVKTYEVQGDASWDFSNTPNFDFICTATGQIVKRA